MGLRTRGGAAFEAVVGRKLGKENRRGGSEVSPGVSPSSRAAPRILRVRRENDGGRPRRLFFFFRASFLFSSLFPSLASYRSCAFVLSSPSSSSASRAEELFSLACLLYGFAPFTFSEGKVFPLFFFFFVFVSSSGVGGDPSASVSRRARLVRSGGEKKLGLSSPFHLNFLPFYPVFFFLRHLSYLSFSVSHLGRSRFEGCG